MNTEQVPSSPAAPTDPFLPPKAWWRYLPGLGKWLVGGFVLFVLFLMALPSTGHVQVKGAQTKAMAQAKQIGLALKLFADDHNGNYPCADLPAMRGAEVKTSNAAFAVLFPKYLTNESIFGNKLSVYQTRQPDNEFDREYTGHPVRTLEPGENVYAYVAGLTDAANPSSPVVADGTDGTGHYTTDAKKRGGVWAGKKAVVIHLDNSGALETLAGPDHARYVVRREEGSPKDEGNLLDVSSLGPEVRLLDPAVGSR